MNEFLSEISIRGRVAIGLFCFENFSKRKGAYHNEVLNVIIEKLAEFTHRKDIDYWDAEMNAYLPNSFKTKVDEAINDEFYDELLLFYNNPEYKVFFQIIELCAAIATHHIYGRITNKSPETLEMLEELLQLTEIEVLNFQKLAEKYSINKNNGWGEVFNFSSFRLKQICQNRISN